jgi:hypothetical protein
MEREKEKIIALIFNPMNINKISRTNLRKLCIILSIKDTSLIFSNARIVDKKYKESVQKGIVMLKILRKGIKFGL